jgi:hypothetical protein
MGMILVVVIPLIGFLGIVGYAWKQGRKMRK